MKTFLAQTFCFLAFTVQTAYATDEWKVHCGFFDGKRVARSVASVDTKENSVVLASNVGSFHRWTIQLGLDMKLPSSTAPLDSFALKASDFDCKFSLLDPTVKFLRIASCVSKGVVPLVFRAEGGPQMLKSDVKFNIIQIANSGEKKILAYRTYVEMTVQDKKNKKHFFMSDIPFAPEDCDSTVNLM